MQHIVRSLLIFCSLIVAGVDAGGKCSCFKGTYGVDLNAPEGGMPKDTFGPTEVILACLSGAGGYIEEDEYGVVYFDGAASNATVILLDESTFREEYSPFREAYLPALPPKHVLSITSGQDSEEKRKLQAYYERLFIVINQLECKWESYVDLAFETEDEESMELLDTKLKHYEGIVTIIKHTNDIYTEYFSAMDDEDSLIVKEEPFKAYRAIAEAGKNIKHFLTLLETPEEASRAGEKALIEAAKLFDINFDDEIKKGMELDTIKEDLRDKRKRAYSA